MNCARRASTPDCWAVEGVGQILLFAGTLTSPSLGARASTPLFSDLSVTAGLYCTQYTCFGDELQSPDHLFLDLPRPPVFVVHFKPDRRAQSSKSQRRKTLIGIEVVQM